LDDIRHPAEQLSQLFGSYKAEWLQERIFELFTEPTYFPDLITSRPCMLVGGRGTGKTTVLRCLSYEGQFELSGRDNDSILRRDFYGFYYRVNTNRIAAFHGPELSERTWTRLFGHYANLLLCGLVTDFLRWYNGNLPTHPTLSPEACFNIAVSLGAERCESLDHLCRAIVSLRVKFESFINNIASDRLPHLSLQGAPIDELMDAVTSLPQFAGKRFFFLIDEYENFLDNQQEIFNTLIKHAGTTYTFKVGVRELGWRKRTTLNANEQLVSPADYIRINISERLSGVRFDEFARGVCNARIQRLNVNGSDALSDIAVALPGLTEDDEAELLGIQETLGRVRDEVRAWAKERSKPIFDSSPLALFFIDFWARSQKMSTWQAIEEMQSKPDKWNQRFENYKHAILYEIHKGKRGIRKYYCGWDVYVQLAATNIRYLLELVDQTLMTHLSEGKSFSDPVRPEIQTKAAQSVGRKNLSELEGLSVHGAQLTKLLLGLGRVFEVMASTAAGHAPEVNQFHLADEKSIDAEILPILDAAVMHLALVRSPGNKLADEADTRAYDYSVHPIFSPFFVFSYRKKRKMKIRSALLMALIKSPREGIHEILRASRRHELTPLPEQLDLFEAYYGSRS
jgi:hypothetical protein